jgi:hypothetical protein
MPSPLHFAAAAALCILITASFVGDADTPVSPDDLAWNEAQYEPAIRKAHAAQTAFDAFVETTLAAHCPAEPFARWGAAWRYEFPRLKTASATASDSADIDVAVLGAAYAPQDGRYRFDFSAVRYTFDKHAVEAAILQGCAEYKAQGRTFLRRIDMAVARKDWDAARALEQRAGAWLRPVRARLEAVLATQSPASDFALIQALQAATPIRR